MRARVLFSVVGASIAAVVLVSASGAATAKTQKVTRIDVSTRVAVIHYLRSIHVNAKGAVIQRGGLNYAGRHCPGVRWTCASTRHTVVQIAKRGGQNRFVCRSSKCVVVQLAGVSRGVYFAGRTLAATAAPKTNSATCIKTGSGATSGGGQSCVISQIGSGPNSAVVYENTQKVSGLAQTAQYTASITQQSTGSNNNTACVTQNINLDGSATNTNGKPTTADLQAHQSILISQDNSGTGTGSNAATNSARYAATSTGACDTSSQLTQSQTLTSTVTATGPITQREDAAYNPCGDGTVGDYANLCLKIDQNQSAAFKCTSSTSCPSSATNVAIFTQNSTQTAVANATKGAPVSQQQSNQPCPNSNAPSNCVAGSGLVGTINQDSSGVSTASPTQNEVQCEDAAISGLSSCSHTADTSSIPSSNLTQKQYGPVGVGNFRQHRRGGRVLFSHLKGLGQALQHGNAADQYTINQFSTQYADVGAFQQNFGNADCTTDGFCTAAQTTTTNGGTTQDGYTAPTITGLAINCPTSGGCVPTPPPAPVLVSTPPDPHFASSGVFTWTEAATGGITLKCNVDGGGFTATNCASGNSFANSYGGHSFQVEAVDAFGNVGGPTTEYDWTNVPPTPTITGNPSASSNSSDATFSFADADTTLTLKCQIDNSGYSTCTSPWLYSNLADGSHTFSVKATDGTHESAVASFTWMISGGGAAADTVQQLNPTADPLGGDCTLGFASGSGFQGTPEKVTDTQSLGAYDGQSVQLRFSFDTVDNRYNAFAGWYLNNIQVKGLQGATPVTVFSDAVVAGDPSFTAFGTNGATPGWHVTNNNGTMGPAWWYGNESTGTYETTSSPIDGCTSDGDTNAGTITTPVFTLASSSSLSFDTLWQIESVNPSNFDLMDVQVIPVTSGPPSP